MNVEFRIPISPTPGFYSQVRFFNFALRRLGGPYQNARLSVVVGDHADLDRVREENAWSEGENVVWHRVPDEIFDRHGIWGTANWRFMIPSSGADAIILSDADTVLVRPVDPIFEQLAGEKPAIAGHMAHLPPPVANSAPPSSSADFWRWLLHSLDVPLPAFEYRYSIDADRKFEAVPAYFNLGFIALNSAALALFASQIMEEEEKILALTASRMRCQLAVTTIAYRAGMKILSLPAEYNLANDERHIAQHIRDMAQVRVIHFLRNEEMNRFSDLLEGNLDDFVTRPMTNPANLRVQALAREYAGELHSADPHEGN